MTDRDARDLAWWRTFAERVTEGSELPSVGSPLLTYRFTVRLYRARRPQLTPGAAVTVTIPCRVWSVNTERGWHHMERAREQKLVREAAGLLSAGLRPMPTPVDIEVQPRIPRKRANQDAANCVTVAKPAIDGLVDAGVIPDDSPRYVRSVKFFAPDPVDHAADEGLTLTIRPCHQEAP